MAEDPPKGAIDADDDLENLVTYEMVEPHICRIALNRPHRRNAILSPDMNELLAKRLEDAQDDDDVKVVILAGNGPDFCAGEDTRRVPAETFGLKKGQKLGQSPRMRGMRKTYESFYKGLLWGDKVVIGAVQGNVLGLGFHFAMSCDMLIVSDDAKFARRQARIGFAGFDAMLPVALMKMGMNRGMEVMLTGRTVTPDELKDWGVANSVVPRDQLEAEALRYARAIAALSTDGLMLGKRAMHQYLHGIGLGAYQSFATVGHPLFTNLVWREDENNFLKARNEHGNKGAWKALNKVFEDNGFE